MSSESTVGDVSDQQGHQSSARAVMGSVEGMPYGTRIRQLGEERPEAVAIVFIARDGSERLVTWEELDTRSTQMARVLASRGLAEGDRLGIKLRNCPEHIITTFAGWKLGAVVIPVRWDLPDWELERVRQVLDPKLVVEPDDTELLEGSRSASTDPLPEVMAPHASGILSSGATGTPKVILRKMPGLYIPGGSPNALIAAYGPLSDPQLVLVPAPLYHNNGFMHTSNLLVGDRLLLMERFAAPRLLDAIERHCVTGFVATTIMLQRLANEPDIAERDLSSIEWVMHGAAPLPEWLARFWVDLVGPTHFFVCYGSSEGAGATFARGDEYLEHPGTVGKGAMDTELRILDDEGNEVPTGEIGAIYMRQPYGVLSEYVGDVEPIPMNADGFATVGDLGWLDGDGYLYLADRRVDMIVTGGANVYPAEVESALSEHPGVDDVVVIGLADEEWGRRVHAIVQPVDPGEPPAADDLVSWCKARLSAYKVPKSIEFIDAIPRSEAFKVNRAALIAEREPAGQGSLLEGAS
jgi:bile acid-coenzyme A ligase